MRKKEMFYIGASHLGLGGVSYLLTMVLDMLFDNRLLINLLCLSFIGLWACMGYRLVKENGLSLKSIFYIHLLPMFVFLVQVFIVLLDMLNFQTNPFLFGQVFFFPYYQLLSNFMTATCDVVVIVSFLLMVTVFTIGMMSRRAYVEN